MTASNCALGLIAILTGTLGLSADTPKSAPKREAPNPPAATKPAVPPKPMPAHLRVVAYHVTIPTDRADQVDHEKLLAAAKSPESLRAELAEFAKPRIFCLIDQDIDLAHKSSIQVGGSRPIPSGSQTFNGQTSTQVSYSESGSIVNLQGGWKSDDMSKGHGTIDFEFSAISDSDIQIAPQRTAAVFLRNTRSVGWSFTSGKPSIFLALDNSVISKGPIVQVVEVTITRLDAEQP